GDDDRVVDAETVAELLGVTLRTARRMLHSLVDEGLAWPMPPARSSKVGRPPRLYQLLVEKVPSEARAARDCHTSSRNRPHSTLRLRMPCGADSRPLDTPHPGPDYGLK